MTSQTGTYIPSGTPSGISSGTPSDTPMGQDTLTGALAHPSSKTDTHKKEVWNGAKPFPSALLLIAGLFLWTVAPPEGLTLQAWHLLIIFLGTIFAVIMKPLPIGAISMISVTLCISTQTLTLDECFTGFSSGVAWLIVMAFFMALGFKTSGLGTRIAYFFVAKLGKSSLGLAYGFVVTELLLAPFIPSNTARGAGVLFPVVKSLAEQQGSDPKKGTRKKLGAYLIQVCFQQNLITSAMFLTGLVGNPLIVSMAMASGVTITWGSWALAAIIPGLLNLFLMPLVLFKIYPPTMRTSPDAKENAIKSLKELGPLSFHEIVMLVTFAVVMTLWILGSTIGMKPTTAAMIGLCMLLFSGALKWQDCIKEKGAWETLMWFAPLLMMATFLTNFGTMKWFSGHVETMVSGLSWPITMAVIVLIYFYIQYIFASVTARITALYAVFLTVLISAGAPPVASAMILAVFSSLSGSLTHFGTGTAPVYFGAGYITVKEWWRNSFVMSLINLSIWCLAGGLWWKLIGLW